jgi:hypothetical protein
VAAQLVASRERLSFILLALLVNNNYDCLYLIHSKTAVCLHSILAHPVYSTPTGKNIRGKRDGYKNTGCSYLFIQFHG